MLSMAPLSKEPLSSLQSWHEQQQPFVRVLASPMVGEMHAALEMMQGAVDQRDARLQEHSQQEVQFVEQLTAIQKQSKEVQVALEASQASVVDLTAMLHGTVDRLAVLEKRLFGKKSEKHKPKTPDARREARKRKRNGMTEEEKKARRDAAGAKRQAELDALRTVQHVIAVDERFTKDRELPHKESVVYEWRPGELVRIEIIRDKQVTNGCIVTAPPPEQVVEGGMYGPALYAKICVEKCLSSGPLRRQERAFARIGVPLPISTICSLFHRAAEVVKPLYDALMVHVSTSPHVQADETPMPVLNDHSTRKGWMWVFATEGALLFAHSPTRSKETPEAVLGKTKGTLTVDGYTGYHSITTDLGRQRGGCWSHARRGLFEARSHDEAFIAPVLADIAELFYIEEVALDDGLLGTPQHLSLRNKKSKPIVERIFTALEQYDAVDGRGSVAKAVSYIRNQREPLQLFLSDPAVPIHNNLSERALRIIALLRKNSLFAGSDEAGQRFAQLLSLLATCVLHQVNPEEWLADVLLAVNHPGLIATDLLPWNWKVGRGRDFQPYYDTR